MQTESFIAGKDAPLETSIRTMRERLHALGFHIEERSWLNPVEGIWSVHIRDRECPLLFTNGKGASRLAALASALGEFFERLSTRYFWTHYYLGETFAGETFTHDPRERWFEFDDEGGWPEGLLTPELRRFYDPEGLIHAELLVDFNSGNRERGICSLPYVRQRDGATVWFPVNLLGNLYVSNGMSAGNTLPEARAQALSEIIERHVKFRIIAEGICLPDVPEEVIARYTGIEAGIRALRDAGFGIRVKDASLGGRYPVMNVTLLNPRDQGCFSSFGAHPRFEIALERALTELLQGRALDGLDGFPAPGFDMEAIAQAQNLEDHFVDSSGIISWNFLGNNPDFEFHDWNFAQTTEEDCRWLMERIHADGYDVYIGEFTHLGVYACRIVVPGMSEIYPVEDLEWDNNGVGNLFREAILELDQLTQEECAEFLNAIEEHQLEEQRPVAPFIGLAPDPDSPWKDLRIGELKLLLALAIGETEAVREGCRWVRHFGQVREDRRRVYGCIESMLHLEDPVDFEEALAELYGRDVLSRATALLNGEQRFFDLSSPGRDLENLDMHRRLLAAYEKARGASAA